MSVQEVSIVWVAALLLAVVVSAPVRIGSALHEGGDQAGPAGEGDAKASDHRLALGRVKEAQNAMGGDRADLIGPRGPGQHPSYDGEESPGDPNEQASGQGDEDVEGGIERPPRPQGLVLGGRDIIRHPRCSPPPPTNGGRDGMDQFVNMASISGFSTMVKISLLTSTIPSKFHHPAKYSFTESIQ
jgi:hypothetical protein